MSEEPRFHDESIMINQTNDCFLAEPLGYLYVPTFAGNLASDNRTQTPPKTVRSIKLCLIIPTCNEAKNIENVIALLNSLLAQVIPEDYELIGVDDNSPDRTWEVVQALLSVYPQLQVMHRQEERELSFAVIRGWQAASGEILGVTDADLQHPPKVLLGFLAAIEHKADLAVASLLYSIRLRFQRRIAFLSRSSKFPLGGFIRFALIRLSGVFVNLSLFYLLSDCLMLAFGLTCSKIFAAGAAIVNNFVWNDTWTFADISNCQNQWSQHIKRLLKFNLICLARLTLNVIPLSVFFNLFGINRYVTNFIAILSTTIWNFWMNLKLSWRVTEPN